MKRFRARRSNVDKIDRSTSLDDDTFDHHWHMRSAVVLEAGRGTSSPGTFERYGMPRRALPGVRRLIFTSDIVIIKRVPVSFFARARACAVLADEIFIIVGPGRREFGTYVINGRRMSQASTSHVSYARKPSPPLAIASVKRVISQKPRHRDISETLARALAESTLRPTSGFRHLSRGDRARVYTVYPDTRETLVRIAASERYHLPQIGAIRRRRAIRANRLCRDFVNGLPGDRC